MTALDLHILCSKKEAFPMVLLEAMSSGVPCLSTNVGDAKSIIGNKELIVEISDSYALASKIRVFYKGKRKLKIIHSKSRKEYYVNILLK